MGMLQQTGAAAAFDEARTIRRLQMRILPFVFLLYVISFLDRINIGFAALTMNRELAITSQEFGLLAGIFFFGYFIFEVPSNLMLHKVGARVWIARILLSWGAVAFLTGFVQTVNQLYALRFLLGVAEAGYFPGIVLYLTYWFRQREQAQAIALVLTGIPFTSIIGGPVSGFILDHVHWLGVSNWRWLLILEAIPALVGGVVTYVWLPSRPSEARFLSEAEKAWVAQELEREERQKLDVHQVSALRALASGRVWHLALMGFTLNIGMYTLSFWLPQLVKSFSELYSNSMIGVLVMIPNLVGLAAMVAVSRSSDRNQERKYHAALSAGIAGSALVALSLAHSGFLSVVLLCFAAVGIYSVYGPLYSLPSEFLTGYAAASGIAVVSSVANLGGFVGPYAIGLVSQRTGSLNSGLALAGISVFVSATLALMVPKARGVTP
jgi:MFS transporter, ACS family, tartrate transporter